MTALDDERLAPHDIGAEMAVLGAVLSWPAALDVAAVLRPQDFYRPGHQLVYEAALSLHERGVPVDAITVANEMRRRGQLERIGGATYLHDLMSSATAVVSTGYHVEIVARLATLRRYIDRFSRGLQLAYSLDADPSVLDELAGQPVDGLVAARPRGLAVIDLEPAEEDTPLPVLICGDRLYRGAVHTLSGPPDSGKTTLACWWMLQAVRAEGSVLFLDEEGGREIVIEKFQALGAKPGERIGYVQFPSRSWTAADVAQLRALLDERRPAIVAWDSSAAFLARAGLDENAAADVTRFYSQVLTMAAREHGAAVLVIDHDTKSSEPSRYARGSGAKLAAVDVAYKIEPVRPFSRTESGTARLKVVKDRRGWLDRAHEVAFLADQAADVALTVSISATSAEREQQPDLTPAERKVLEALDTIPRTIRELTDRIATEHGHGLTRPTVQKSLSRLMELGLARQAGKAPDSSQLWRSADE